MVACRRRRRRCRRNRALSLGRMAADGMASGEGTDHLAIIWSERRPTRHLNTVILEGTVRFLGYLEHPSVSHIGRQGEVSYAPLPKFKMRFCGRGRTFTAFLHEIYVRLICKSHTHDDGFSETRHYWCVYVDMYRARNKSLYVVARISFLLLLNCSAWPCLAVA